MELFAKLISGLRLLTIFTKHFILDVWQGSSADQINGLGLYDRDLRHEKVNSSKVNKLEAEKIILLRGVSFFYFHKGMLSNEEWI